MSFLLFFDTTSKKSPVLVYLTSAKSNLTLDKIKLDFSGRLTYLALQYIHRRPGSVSGGDSV